MKVCANSWNWTAGTLITWIEEKYMENIQTTISIKKTNNLDVIVALISRDSNKTAIKTTSLGAGRGNVQCMISTATKNKKFLVLKMLTAMFGAADCTNFSCRSVAGLISLEDEG